MQNLKIISSIKKRRTGFMHSWIWKYIRECDKKSITEHCCIIIHSEPFNNSNSNSHKSCYNFSSYQWHRETISINIRKKIVGNSGFSREYGHIFPMPEGIWKYPREILKFPRPVRFWPPRIPSKKTKFLLQILTLIEDHFELFWVQKTSFL